MTAETGINKELLAKVRDKVRTTPEAYDQNVWGMSSDDAPCGTVACIAGWCLILSGKATPKEVHAEEYENGHLIHFHDEGAELLGISRADANRLFAGGATGWPEPFKTRYERALTEEAEAVVAADYLQHIIDTGKVTE